MRELWADTFLAQIEPKTGAVTLVNAEPKKRAKKRRRVDESPFKGDVANGVEAPLGDDGMLMDIDQDPFLGEDDWGHISEWD